MEIRSAIVNNVEQRCLCGFTMDRIQLGGFLCFPDETQDSVAYRAELHGNAGANSSSLITIIEQWVAEGVAISIQALFISVDRECTVAISSLAAPELCPSSSTLPPVTTGLDTMTDAVTLLTSDMTTMDTTDSITEATTMTVPPPGLLSEDTNLIIAIIVAVVVLALIVAIVIIVYFVLKSRRAELKFQVKTR